MLTFGQKIYIDISKYFVVVAVMLISYFYVDHHDATFLNLDSLDSNRMKPHRTPLSITTAQSSKVNMSQFPWQKLATDRALLHAVIYF